jgi:hypothetical protein
MSGWQLSGIAVVGCAGGGWVVGCAGGGWVDGWMGGWLVYVLVVDVPVADAWWIS